MPRKPGENYLEYKKRILDPISPSFCAAKWKNATIFLNQGLTTSCHHPVAHKIGRWEVFKDPSAIHNSKVKKKERQMMLTGKRPEGCEYCWQVEDLKKDLISDRVYKTEIYEDREIADLETTHFKSSVNPQTLELSFSRTCNFACAYCNADFSTTWAQDIKENGSYKNFVTKDPRTYMNAGSPNQLKNEKNPYVVAFWKWFPQLSKDLKQLRITGGEPLMSKDVWLLFDKLAQPENQHIRFAINTNLGASPHLIKRLIEKSHDIPHLEVYTSNEAVGDHAEYIRDGLDYDRWKQNCLDLLEHGKVEQLHIMMTINALCLFSITDLLEEILTWRDRFHRPVGIWSMNILRFPSFMSVLSLPDEIKAERVLHLSSWLESNRSHPFLLDMEVANLERLIGYLQDATKPHPKSEERRHLWGDFKTFFEQYDQRRGKSFEKTFKGHLSEWYASLKANPKSKSGPLGWPPNLWDIF